MKSVCAWCGRPLRDVPSRSGDQWITHGICTDCRDQVLAGMGVPLSEFLDALPQPVLVVDGDAVVLATNESARRMGNEGDGNPKPDADGDPKPRLGDVFECVNAKQPEGCGRTVHCSGCTIRHTVEHTFETGEAKLRVPATLTAGSEEEPEEVGLWITTEKVGGHVLLRVDGKRHRGNGAE